MDNIEPACSAGLSGIVSLTRFSAFPNEKHGYIV